MLEAYLDIETTGLSCVYDSITVIGIYLTDSHRQRLVQLVGEDVTRDNLLRALAEVTVIYTYNGSRFDLPFVLAYLGVDLRRRHHHCDLMYHCWQNNLYGGFKAVERQLGISRELSGIGGLDAVWLWRKFRDGGDRAALQTLLKYNEEDVVNLRVLRERLGLAGAAI
jgi:uncharacterized protein YprB with RNaseH-like and TPR domain